MNTEQTSEKKTVIGITHGDINGISYEIILKALKDNRIFSNFTPVIYGSPKVAAYYKKVMNLSTLNLNHVASITEIDPEAINIINCTTNKIRVEIGKSTEMAGISSLNAIRHALIDLKQHKLDLLITAPINKQNIQSTDFDFKGHTDFLKNEFQVDDVLMMMIADDLKVVVVTEHIPIAEVSQAITEEKILSKLRLMDKTLRRDFAISRPKIAVLGLNPHAGDMGLIGKEDDEIIAKAIEKAKNENIIAIGPFSADGFFGAETYSNFDATLAMYHDQGLTPFKILAKGGGVNFTAGLPIIRTSPAHGTAFEIAGKNKANPKSFIDAIYTALDIKKRRETFDKIIPLNKQTNFSEDNNNQSTND
ncbi:MAG: 4-hydroxythreonine-4-phosphate dehydrogenase PdxA [Bacteroidales bacterium]|nr:4-hydroxythreonine-4-phosphate dehydrogenase PdxA [Bacteroidales bacterium]